MKKKFTHNKIQAILFQLQRLHKKIQAKASQKSPGKVLFETSNNRSSGKEDFMRPFKFKLSALFFNQRC